MAKKIAERLSVKRVLWQTSNGKFYLELEDRIIWLNEKQALIEQQEIERENRIIKFLMGV